MKQSISIHCYDFDDYKVGEGFRTTARTITEADLVMFSTLTGDTNPLHMDAEYAREGVYGKRVCHGLMIVSYAAGLINKVGFIDGSTIALRQMDWQFRHPVFPGELLLALVVVAPLTPDVAPVGHVIGGFTQEKKPPDLFPLFPSFRV